MIQLNIFDYTKEQEEALPELWVIRSLPANEGVYKCKVKKNNGLIQICDLNYKNQKFDTKDEVIMWR